MGTAGTRWGIDKDQDGSIDFWKVISPEELSAEAVHAVRDNDAKRFERLLLSDSELGELGLGTKKAGGIAERIEASKANFASMPHPKRQWIAAANGSALGLINQG